MSTSSDSTDADASAALSGADSTVSDAAASGAGASDATASDPGAADGAAALRTADDGAPETRRRTAVMADVARLAGVSHQTVSRVINDSAHVRPETRRRVLAAMRTLDYRPNPAARALVTGRSRTQAK